MASKNDICNMAISQLGNYDTISDIDTPTNDKERVCAVWYDICRQFVLKTLIPNFAQSRVIVSQLAEVPLFGYSYYYEYPDTALRILGIGNAEDKANDYAIELTPDGVKAIAHDTDYEDGAELRIIRDVEDINLWSVEAKLLLAQYIAAYTCLAVTQDEARATRLKRELPKEISAASSLNAQENVPVRISNSRFKASRFSDSPNFASKK